MKFEVIDTKTNAYPNLKKIALKEKWAQGLCYCDMEGFLLDEEGNLYLADECGNCVCCPLERFKVVFIKE